MAIFFWSHCKFAILAKYYKSFAILEDLISTQVNFEPTLAKICYCANFRCYKWPNIERKLDYLVTLKTSNYRAQPFQVLKLYLEKRNLTVEGSITWLSHQKCDDMFIYSKWNGTTTYGFGSNERDFGTDYGICCWYTPQLNFSAIPDGPDTDWAFWFNSVPRGKSLIYEVSMVLHKLVLFPTYMQ